MMTTFSLLRESTTMSEVSFFSSFWQKPEQKRIQKVRRRRQCCDWCSQRNENRQNFMTYKTVALFYSVHWQFLGQIHCQWYISYLWWIEFHKCLQTDYRHRKKINKKLQTRRFQLSNSSTIQMHLIKLALITVVVAQLLLTSIQRP